MSEIPYNKKEKKRKKCLKYRCGVNEHLPGTQRMIWWQRWKWHRHPMDTFSSGSRALLRFTHNHRPEQSTFTHPMSQVAITNKHSV
jgi:hypothetical protein